MVVRNISQAKAELPALIEEVQKGNEVILALAKAAMCIKKQDGDGSEYEVMASHLGHVSNSCSLKPRLLEPLELFDWH